MNYEEFRELLVGGINKSNKGESKKRTTTTRQSFYACAKVCA